jgi:hypothetical protein
MGRTRLDLKVLSAKSISIEGGCAETGHLETGHLETGHLETGHLETGHLETGHLETGHLETGHLETGSGREMPFVNERSFGVPAAARSGQQLDQIRGPPAAFESFPRVLQSLW